METYGFLASENSGHFVLLPLQCQRLSNTRHQTKVTDGHCAGCWWHLLTSPEGFLCPGRQDANFCFSQQKHLYWQLNPCRSKQSPLRASFTCEFRKTRIPFSSPNSQSCHTDLSHLLGVGWFSARWALELWQVGSKKSIYARTKKQKDGDRTVKEKQLCKAEAVMEPLFRTTEAYTSRW